MRIGNWCARRRYHGGVSRRGRRCHGAERIPRDKAATPRLIVPHESWSCGMPAGIPAPETGTLVFTAEMPLERVADIGRERQ